MPKVNGIVIEPRENGVYVSGNAVLDANGVSSVIAALKDAVPEAKRVNIAKIKTDISITERRLTELKVLLDEARNAG